ncbi:MAG: hypothetical protein Q8O01_06290 [Candidatus Omnitrophota bacterium]|nr:hypothetical protein [Candidatus Omnitrophota bacterium]
MSLQHQELALGRWNKLSLVEQMANIGSEVERALKWKSKNNTEYCMSAFERALELLDITLDSCKERAHLKEIARTREVLVDFFFDSNQFTSSASSLRSYFLQFACAARRNK